MGQGTCRRPTHYSGRYQSLLRQLTVEVVSVDSASDVEDLGHPPPLVLRIAMVLVLHPVEYHTSTPISIAALAGNVEESSQFVLGLLISNIQHFPSPVLLSVNSPALNIRRPMTRDVED